MCLEIVDRKIRKEICTGVGWKTFVKKDGKLFGEYENWIKERPEHKWLDEEKFRKDKGRSEIHVSCLVENEYYHTGWHIFPTRKEFYSELHRGIIKRVGYKHVFSTGKQNNRDVIVARWIRIGGKKRIKY